MAWVTVAMTGKSLVEGEINARNEERLGRVRQKGADYEAAMQLANALEIAGTIRRQGRELIGNMRGAYAGSGVLLDQGTPALVQDAANQDIEHDASQAILQGARRANALRAGGQLQALDASVQADATRTESYANAFQYGYQAYRQGKQAGWFTRSKQPAAGGGSSLGAYNPFKQ